MIALSTPVSLPPAPPRLSYGQAVMSLGSCFSQSIATRLRAGALDVLVNPFGIQYNPLSIAAALERILEGRPFEAGELVETSGGYASLLHHGSFTRRQREEALELMNSSLERAVAQLERLDFLLLTWGTSYVYRWGETGCVVSNCHKLPERLFHRQRVSLDELAAYWLPLLERLFALRPELQIITTVSPVRHLRDGAVGNARSKATLLLLSELLAERYPEQLHYFPSYELMMDELRDYRYYAEDMTHPSELAERLIAERLTQWWLSPEAQRGLTEAERLLSELRHRPLSSEPEAHRERLERLEAKLAAFYRKYPSALDLAALV